MVLKAIRSSLRLYQNFSLSSVMIFKREFINEVHLCRYCFSLSLKKSQLGNLLFLGDNLLPYKRSFNFYSLAEGKRHFSKKKKSSYEMETDENSDDEEIDESIELGEVGGEDNIVIKSVPSMRMDSVMKAALAVTKKRIENSFYANKIRINGNIVVKKATFVREGDEIDLIKGFSPDNNKYLIVDRVLVMSIGKVSGTGNFPLKMQIFRSLVIENYNQPWNPSSTY